MKDTNFLQAFRQKLILASSLDAEVCLERWKHELEPLFITVMYVAEAVSPPALPDEDADVLKGKAKFQVKLSSMPDMEAALICEVR